MGVANTLQQGFDKILSKAGRQVIIRYCSDHRAKVFLGSKTLLATVPAYSLVDTGTFAPEAESIPVYKRAFIRLLPTGSFIGEA